MPSMTKRVNVVTRVAVRNITPPISGSYKNIVMSTSDILKLLSKRASVEEILPDGSTVKLTMKNYYLDNGAGLDAYAGVDLDKKYNTNKDSKKNRGPIVHTVKGTTPAKQEQEHYEELIRKEDEIIESNEELVNDESVSNDEIAISDKITINEDVIEEPATESAEEEIVETIEEVSEDSTESDESEEVESDDEEEYVEEEDTADTAQPTSTNSNNTSHKKKKKKK